MPKRPFSEVFEGPGFRIVRRGRWTFVDSHRTPEEHRALLTSLAEYHQKLPDTIRAKVTELEHLLQRFNPLDVIANVALKNLFTNPETYKEYAHEGAQAHVEYVTLLSLKSPFRAGETRLISGPDLDKIFLLLKEIFHHTIWYYATEHVDPERPDPPSVTQELRFHTIVHELMVRNPGYAHHLEDLLRGLFGPEPASSWLQATLGFNIEDAIRLSRATASLFEKKLRERADQARAQRKGLLSAVRRFKRTGEAPDETDRELLQRLATVKEKKLQGEISHVAVGWVFYAIGDTSSFTAAELAAEAGVGEAIAEDFLKTFVIGFGSVPSDFSLPAPTHPLQQTPILRHPNGFLCPVPGMTHWAIRPRFEALMKADRRLWDRYQKARAAFLVDEALRLLGSTLRRAQIFRNLQYTVETPKGPQPTELDGLAVFDTVLFLLEAKSGELTPAARRGAPLGMTEDLRALVAEPHRQALRARDYIRNADVPMFTTPDGQSITLDRARYHTTILVTVTAEPLDIFTTTLYRLKDLGIFADDELPWAVQILDLRVISELIEFPSQFVHYLIRRLRLNQLAKITAHDELDWFGHYLSEGLYFDWFFRETNAGGLRLQTYTTEIDDYYLYTTGQRQTPAPKPRQPMPDLYRELLREIEEKDGDGYVLVSTTLLELGWPERKQIAKYLQLTRERARRDGKIHDFTLVFTESQPTFGLTIMAARDQPPGEFARRLEGYCRLKKYQTRVQRWVGIGTLAREPGLVHLWVANDSPWTHDETL